MLVRWKGLPNLEDSLEPLKQVFEDVPEMVKRLLLHKHTSLDIADKARRMLAL